MMYAIPLPEALGGHEVRPVLLTGLPKYQLFNRFGFMASSKSITPVIGSPLAEWAVVPLVMDCGVTVSEVKSIKTVPLESITFELYSFDTYLSSFNK